MLSGKTEYDNIQCELKTKAIWKCNEFTLNQDDEPIIPNNSNNYDCISHPNISTNIFIF